MTIERFTSSDPEPRLEQVITPEVTPPKEVVASIDSQGGDNQQVLAHVKGVEDLFQPTFGKEWQKLEFDNAAKFLLFFSESLVKGRVTLYSWQVEELERFSFAKASQQNPYKYALCACNGSGKDLFFIAPVALYLICCNIRFRCIITSASAKQLNDQSERYIVSLAREINNWSIGMFGGPILKINQHHITCLLSGSEIILYVTDEEGKAEGYHPYEDGDMAIIVNEAKSIEPELFRAIRRCTGFKYLLYVSSPGAPQGDFYHAYTTWPNTRRITFFDCPHHARSEFEEDRLRLGENDYYFRSKWLAAFTPIDGSFVLSGMALERLRRNTYKSLVKEVLQGEPLRIGIDLALSGNGDETVISAFKGNKQVAQVIHKDKDATKLADKLEKSLLLLGIDKSHAYIFADDGGVGRGVIDILNRSTGTGGKGWAIHRVLNQSPAINRKQFGNRGAEMWHKFARLIEAGCLILLPDEVLHSQLSSRKYKESNAALAKMTLQGKKEMIASGLKSPDRADAAILALCGVDILKFLEAFEYTEPVKEMKSEEDKYRDLEDSIRQGHYKRKPAGKIRSSLNALFSRDRKTQKQLNWRIN